MCCKPKARCFKGLAILCGIYSLACGLMLMIIPPVVKSHGDESDPTTKDHMHSMVLSTSILLIIFAGLAILNVLCCKVYERKEKRHESIIRGELMNNFDNFGNDIIEPRD